MARELRQDIPSRRARSALNQLAPGMADLNPAPGVGRTVPPPSGNLDQAPAGTFQVNRALNGEQGVASRQRARARQSALTSGVAPNRVLSPLGWDSGAFPADHDLFEDDLVSPGGENEPQHGLGGGVSPPAISSHSAHFLRDSELEGGSAAAPRGRGPVAPGSPDSAGESLSFLASSAMGCCLGVGSPRWRVCCAALTRSPRSGHLVPVVACVDRALGTTGALRVCLLSGTFGALAASGDVWCPWDCWCPCCLPGVRQCWSVSLGAVLTDVCSFLWFLVSDLSEWEGIDGELRVFAPPVLGTPFELRPAKPTEDVQYAFPPVSMAEQFRAASRSQSRQERLHPVESPTHEKVVRSQMVPAPSPRRVVSLEDGGRSAVRHGDHTRRRSKSMDRMDVDPVVGGGIRSRAWAFPDPRTARYLEADPVGMLTSVNPHRIQ
ncbi:hypothetical protein EV361DRAFT_953504 [Lentinula raphanica]|nr:hypothetical protein EV361DRAFT_953504 [Lentinula raphanica]